MTTLRASPFFLLIGEYVIATVEALNAIEFSDESTPNTTGATIRTEPQKPTSTPVRVDLETTDRQITVSYANLLTSPDNGGSTITSLNLWWD